MIRIINGKKYDTNTAEIIAEYSDGDYITNHYYFLSETLYRKKNGEFFILADGGGMTVYATSPEIFTISFDDAKKWVETHASEKYESIFGEVAE